MNFIAFKGLSDENVEPEVIFFEIKSGKSSSLTEREKKVRDAILNKRIRYEVIDLNAWLREAKEKLNKEIEKEEKR